MTKQRSKKAKKQRREVPILSADERGAEERRSEAVTVAWMLAMLATTGANVLALLAGMIVPQLVSNSPQPGLAPILPRLLLFIAAISGTVCMLLTPFVYQFRRDPPPLPITAFGVVVCITPVALLFYWSL